jgi:ABC-type lipoprotein release transport system permease subunit
VQQLAMPSTALLVFLFLIVVIAGVGIYLFVRFLYMGLEAAAREKFPVGTVLGVAVLGVIALVCVSAVAYGLSIGQTGSIETIQDEQLAQEEQQPAQNEQPPTEEGQAAQGEQAVLETQAAQEAQADQVTAGTVGVVSNSQGLGILATIASAAVGGIAGVLVQRQ